MWWMSIQLHHRFTCAGALACSCLLCVYSCLWIRKTHALNIKKQILNKTQAVRWPQDRAAEISAMQGVLVQDVTGGREAVPIPIINTVRDTVIE